MAKASLKLPNGTAVQVEGTPEEIRKLLAFYGGSTDRVGTAPPRAGSTTKKGNAASSGAEKDREPDIIEIVNLIKESDEAAAIEKHILDRTSSVDRTLLPFYVVHEQLHDTFGLTSGDINRVLKELGVPIATSNIAHTLSGSASRYVIGNRPRTKGVPVRYKLSRKGLLYLKSVIAGDMHGK